MKTTRLVFADRNRVEVEDAELDVALAPDQVLVRSLATMVSQGTELAALTGTHTKSERPDRPAWLRFPSVPGYLCCGEVIDRGSAVTTAEIGDRVIAEGGGCWNSHASHMVSEGDANSLVVVPEAVPSHLAAMTKLASIGICGLRVLHHEFAENLAVFGLGIVGQLALRCAAIAGFDGIVGVDPVAERRAVAAAVPGVTAVGPDEPPVAEGVDGAVEFDNVNEASGHPAAFLQACAVARRRGKVAITSSPHRPVEVRLYDHIHSKGLQVLGAHGSCQSWVPTVNERWTEPRQKRLFLDLVARGRLEVEPLVSRRVPYTEAPAAYRDLIEQPGSQLGVVFDWE